MFSAILKTKIMIDKKKLIEELLDCVADATDTETQITSLTMAGMLMNEVLDEALTIPAGVERSEQLKAFNCVNFEDEHGICKEQCDYCKRVKGF
jgi:hypothetical protein